MAQRRDLMPRPNAQRPLPNRQAGVTLIELMISMSLTSLVVGLVFSIHTRMTTAFNRETQVSDLTQMLQAGSEIIATDIRMAGDHMADGFQTNVFGTPNIFVPAISVENNPDGTGSDVIHVYRGESASSTPVVNMDTATRQFVDVASSAVAS